MVANLLRTGMVLISWSSLLMYPKHSFRRFFPVVIFISSLVSILLVLSKPLNLWRVAGGTAAKIFNDLSFVLGPFIAATLWVFQLSYGSIWKYLGVNFVLDYLLAFPASALFKRLKVYELERLIPIYFFAAIYLFSIMGYAFQYIIRESRR
ncbi:hypothetical protein [Bacillus sp. REN3]|uniref:hypothetical protein n=1 Tax=Bacillus sp. REN3 TaxID=2802440 RepID=UPI001AED81D8|nr:hypothetical protein [Bacillus sp. REN3]